MQLLSSYPVVLTDHVRTARDFFTTHFGFDVTFDSDWYVSLKHRDAPHYELAFLRHDHDTIPATGRARAQGILLNFEVADATREWDRLRATGAPVLLPIRDEAFGQRHFILEGPGGVMIDIIENIAPAAEFASSYGTAPAS